jgi:hypothetical protein
MAESGKLRPVAQICLLYDGNLHQDICESKKASVVLCKLNNIQNIHVLPLIYYPLSFRSFELLFASVISRFQERDMAC